jgi:hypothetical protein
MKEIIDYILKSELTINGLDKWNATGLFGVIMAINAVDFLLSTIARLFNFLINI